MSKADAMTTDWDRRARENAYHWVDSRETAWDKQKYYEGGERDMEKYVLPFFRSRNVTESMASKFTVVDIGCGTGRLSRAMARKCASVIGVDVSGEMIVRAKQNNSDLQNIAFLKTSGEDLAVIPDASVDFCFSFIVFQHIPSKSVIRSYFQEMKRVLRPGGLAKVQVRGTPGNPPGKVLWFHGGVLSYLALVLWRGVVPLPWIRQNDTVYGACFSETQLKALAAASGFGNIRTEHETDRYLWVEMRKPF